MNLHTHHSNGPLTLKNLDDYNRWPIKHRHWQFEVVEDESHDVWVSTRDLRSFYEKFPSDRDLKAVYQCSVIVVKDIKTHFLSERAMRLELRKSKSHSSHIDVLKFLDWFERNVTQVAARKRGSRKLDERNAIRDAHAKEISDGPLQRPYASPLSIASTLPLSEQERWRLEQTSDEIRKVFHPEARIARTTWSGWCSEQWVSGLRYAASFWRGERNLFLTFGMALLVAMLPGCVFDIWVPESLDWTVDFGRVLWAFALTAPLGWACAAWFLVSMTRSARRSWKSHGGKLWATAFYIMVFPIAPVIAQANTDLEMLEHWGSMVFGSSTAAGVYADPFLGRVVLRGDLDFGSSEALQKVLDQNPKLTLLQIESPGGFVIEGMRMAKIVSDRKMDTVSLEKCASACTFILAAGQDRYLGPDVRVGFHRSGHRYGPVSLGWSETDHQMAKYYRQRGVNEAFVQKALTPSIREIWVAPHSNMYAAGYASLRWSERKSGY